MTALVDDTFRVLAAARQHDNTRVAALLARMSDDDVFTLAELVGNLRVPVAAEVAFRAYRVLDVR